MKKLIKVRWIIASFPKMDLKMKLTTILLIVSLLKVQANTYSQNTKLTLNEKDATVGQVFNQIESMSEFRFLYESQQIDLNRKVTVQVENKKITDVLSLLFKGTNVVYKTNDRQIILTIKENNDEKPIDVNTQGAIQTIRVDGNVTDEKGMPLPGVNILEKNTSNGTQTDFDGNYAIAVSYGNSTLVFSYVGYLTQEILVGDQTSINVSLKEDVAKLDEVVVVGYGVQKKTDLTGSIVSINSEKLTNTPVTNTLETLQGRVAGLDITRASGQAGAGLNFTIRGNRSLVANNAPLILVDGIQYGSYIDINPNDIESVEVLKDASSTAIYGSRGANGVILITTKTGKKGKTTVEFNSYTGLNSLTDYRKFSNTEQYVAKAREAYRAAGQWSSPADDATVFGNNYDNITRGVNTDWPSLMLKDGSIQNYHLAFSGGSEKTSFRISSEFFKEKGLLVNDQLTRFVQRINLDHQVFDNLKVGVGFSYNDSNNDTRNTSFWNLIKLLPTGEPYNEDGAIKEFPFPGSVNLNPLFDEKKENYYNNTRSNRVFLTGYAKWNIVNNLSLKSNFGLTVNNSQQGVFEGTKSTWAMNNNGFSKSSLTDNNSRNWTWENVLNYNNDFGKHSLNAILGNSILTYRSTMLSGEGRNQAFESSLFYNLNTNTDNIRTFSDLSENNLASFFGRLNYKFNDKYLLTLSFRADGASVLAEGNKWAYFPSAAVAWRLSEENFLADSNFISNLKARLSYGVSGNSAIAPYQTQGGVSKLNFAFNESPAFGYIPTTIANTELGWETTATTNFGLDFGFLKNRITGSIDLYKTQTDDLLMQSILPSLTGYYSIIANIGKTETKGIDIILSTTNIQTDNFTWSTDFNFTTNKEKIVELSVGGDDVSNAWFVGQPINVFYDYEKVGIWQTADADLADSFGKVPGQIRVRDQNNDGSISAADDRIVIGQKTPKWTAGMTNNFSYKNLNLSVLLYARVGQTIDSEFRKMYYDPTVFNTPVVDYWTPENPTNNYPRPVLGDDQYLSTMGYIDGSFVKIKEITLNYQLPKTDSGVLKDWDVSIYGTAKNFFTFSKINDYDPERGGSATFPLTKQIVLGLNIRI